MRASQADDICQALMAGKHVYAEKPLVTTLADLERVLHLAGQQDGRSSKWPAQPSRAMLPLARWSTAALWGPCPGAGTQVYPYADWRPQDERLDGGLIMQCGIHAVRMIEHVAGQKITAVAAVETGLGNPKTGELSMAASLSMRLESGGVASVVANYLNQPGLGCGAMKNCASSAPVHFVHRHIRQPGLPGGPGRPARNPLGSLARAIYSLSLITCAEKVRVPCKIRGRVPPQPGWSSRPNPSRFATRPSEIRWMGYCLPKPDPFGFIIQHLTSDMFCG